MLRFSNVRGRLRGHRRAALRRGLDRVRGSSHQRCVRGVKDGVIGMIRPGLMMEAVGVLIGGNLGYPALSAESKLKFET